MNEERRTILLCSCDDTMQIDVGAVQKGCRKDTLATARQLCRTDLEQFRAALSSKDAIVVGCTQEAPLFSDLAEQNSPSPALSFVNLRETGGWSTDGSAAGPKMAALLAAAAEPAPSFPLINLSSEGVTLIYGRDERAIEAARLLQDHLDVTVLINQPNDLEPARVTNFPVVKGTIRNAKGHFGAFEIAVDDYAMPLASSRGVLTFGPARNGAVSHCDLIIDLSGGAPLFPAHDLRDGYLRADPASPADVLAAVLKARDLVGSFDKPRYIVFDESRCAHSRSRIVGCQRCLDLCPTGAITPAGDHVAIDPHICAGCGQCASICPTGAASYALPPADTLMRKLRALLITYRDTGGTRPIVLLHDEEHGGALIDALARHGDGLPANVLPLAVNEVTQIGLETIAAAFAYGAMAARFVLRASPRHDMAGLAKTIALADTILGGLGFSKNSVATVETDDPDALGAALRAIGNLATAPRPASFAPAGEKRGVLRLALRELHRAAPQPVDVIALPDGAPFGKIELNVEGCTLCLSCVSACPTGALSDDPERPTLRFAEDACVQCGLCKATCPEKVITLTPQLDFRAATASSRVLKEEEPFHCIRCAKPFGVRSTVERVAAKLEGKHWMFANSANRLDVIKMCADCRAMTMTEENFDPFNAPARPKPRTTEDYLRERDRKSES